MADFLNDKMNTDRQIYKALSQKCIDGNPLTSEEWFFIFNYRKSVERHSAVSPFKKIISGVKEIINLISEENKEDGV